MRYVTTVGEKEYLVEIIDEVHVLLNGKMVRVDFDTLNEQPIFSLLVDGNSYEAYVYAWEEAWQVLLHGRLYQMTVIDESEKKLRLASTSGVSERAEYHLKAPMPGMVISMPVLEGQEVRKGEVLAILESMKMHNELKSPRDGKVNRMRVKTGDTVEQQQTILSVI